MSGDDTDWKCSRQGDTFADAESFGYLVKTVLIWLNIKFICLGIIESLNEN